MKKFANGAIKSIVKVLLSGVIGAVVVGVAVFVLHLESRPELKIWHEATLDEEFTVDAGVDDFDGYLALEDRLFAQLNERVLDHIEPEDQRLINRYHRGSLSDPARWPQNWNRTFELPADHPKVGVLLLHGMSDSPYSLRSIGQRLHESGAWVVGFRLPGHGTAPSGLVEVKYEDMAAAVQLAMDRLREKVADRPLYIVGYSNGGALAIHYVFRSIDDPLLPQVKGVALISPSIGVTKVAALAVWQDRLGNLLGLDKLAWTDLLPEYDPFKYSSFAVNAGHQVYRLTGEIQQYFTKFGESGKLKKFPPIIAFQSAVDATVSTRAVVKSLFAKLPKGGHEFVLFDINRISEIESVLTNDPKEDINTVINNPNLNFTFSLISNSDEASNDVVLRQTRPQRSDIAETPLNMIWPRGLYSLSHIATPFPMNDRLYGKSGAIDRSIFQLGNMDLRGERGVLQISASAMLRLRWNPFYPYLEQRLLEMMDLPWQPELLLEQPVSSL
ncbi:MAG: alpha/beta hydrolase [Gammaproteobacteria bacterium]|nr:MAG: alpha/beta hydrolase [Gammaproteobacteria bacterium]